MEIGTRNLLSVGILLSCIIFGTGGTLYCQDPEPTGGCKLDAAGSCTRTTTMMCVNNGNVENRAGSRTCNSYECGSEDTTPSADPSSDPAPTPAPCFRLSCLGLTPQSRDGGYTAWTQWGVCSEACGDSGVQTRSRSCTNPSPLGSGRNCDSLGSALELRTCSGLAPCGNDLLGQEVIGGYSDWTQWSQCPTSCGTGLKSRRRSCPGAQDCSQLGPVEELHYCINYESCLVTDFPPERRSRTTKPTVQECRNGRFLADCSQIDSQFDQVLRDNGLDSLGNPLSRPRIPTGGSGNPVGGPGPPTPSTGGVLGILNQFGFRK